MKSTFIHILVCLICFVSQVKAQDFPYRYLPPITIAPTEEASCMLFDKEGMMWVGTNAGVKSYDGYHVKTYKANAYQPGILPNNTQVDWNEIIFKALTLKGIYGREMWETWYQMEQMIISGIDLTPIITHRFNVDDYQQGFDVMESGQCGKVMLSWE